MLLVSSGIGPGVAPAFAACTQTPPSADQAIAAGDIVFVGTVVSTENDGRWATVHVDERWKGASRLGDQVQIVGGPEPSSATAFDRSFGTGRYLFVVTTLAGEIVDNACSGTRPWTDDLAALRPSGVPDTISTGFNFAHAETIIPLAVLGLALMIAIIAYLYVLRSRRRPPDWMR